MIHGTFALSEIGSVREENQDSYLLDVRHGIFAVADGLGGLPNGARASRLTVELLRKILLREPLLPLYDMITWVNQETRNVGYSLDVSGFGSTLTMARLDRDRKLLEIGHVGDSAAYLVHAGTARLLTLEHTVAARMVAEKWEDASEAIPLTAHHTLTQCMGQDLYIDPQIFAVPVHPGDRFFLFTDGITKNVAPSLLEMALLSDIPLEEICQRLTFRAEAAGSPDNYTIVAVGF